jgi:hypothetical protein
MAHLHATGAAGRADPAAAARRAGDARHEADHGVGWLVFAAVVIALAGVLNTIYGAAAISTSDFYVPDVEYVLGGLETFGWLMVVLGVAQFFAALGILAFTGWGPWVGVAVTAANAIVQLLVMPAAPLVMLTIFSVDVLVVYGLITYGGRWREP